MIFGYVKVRKITENVMVEVQRRIDNNIENSDWNEGVMFILNLIEKEFKLKVGD